MLKVVRILIFFSLNFLFSKWFITCINPFPLGKTKHVQDRLQVLCGDLMLHRRTKSHIKQNNRICRTLQSPVWGLGVMAHTCNPSTLGGGGGWITRGQEFRDQPGQHGQAPSLLKIQKLAGRGGSCL